MSTREPRKGAAIVEFAILLLLLLLILAGVVEFGFLWLQSHYLTNAAREGARVAGKVEKPLSDDREKVNDAVKEYLHGIYNDAKVDDCCDENQFLHIEVNPLSVKPPADKYDGYQVTVTVKEPIRIFSGKDGLLSFIAPNDQTMTKSAFFACDTVCATE